jgi:20S proteasome alpha/beta subunit
MTIIVALICRDGVVFASDSQRSDREQRDTITKLFTSPAGIIWGGAGSISIQQELEELMRTLPATKNPRRTEATQALKEAVVQARDRAIANIEEPSLIDTSFAALFAWWSDEEERFTLLRVRGSGHAERDDHYRAVGGPERFARFALGRLEFLDFDSLPLETAEMIAVYVVEDVIRDASVGVCKPIQVAAVTREKTMILSEIDVRVLEETGDALRDQLRSWIVPQEEEEEGEAPPEPDTGIRP